MKITDMNLICIEECLEYLELDDLLNVADSNKRLRKAAECVFLRKLGQRSIQINYCRQVNPNFWFNRNINLHIHDLKFALQLLRCFGHLITSLDLCYFDKPVRIFAYTNEYCAKSVTKISFDDTKEIPLRQLKNPFPKVLEVDVRDSEIAKTGWFNYLFPNMQRLCYSGGKPYHIDSIACAFPNLQHLGIICPELFKKKSVLDCLRLNPQLKTLCLNAPHITRPPFFTDEDTLRNLIEPMQYLEELYLDGDFARLPSFIGNEIHLKNVKKFKIRGFYGSPKCPFTFNRLESFELWYQLMDDFYDFIDRHPTIEKLKLYAFAYYQWSHIDVALLIKALPLLKEIETYGRVPLSVDDVVDLVSGLQLLQSIKVDNEESVIFTLANDLGPRLGDEWQVSIVWSRKLHLRRSKQ